MPVDFSRRTFFETAIGVGLAARAAAQQKTAGLPEPVTPYPQRATVAWFRGSNAGKSCMTLWWPSTSRFVRC